MTLQLKPEIRDGLMTIQFVKKYDFLSQEFNGEKVAPKDRLIYYDVDEIIDTINDLGYSVSFDKKESFFKIVERVDDKLEFGFNIGVDSGMADFVWIVRHNGELRLGSPWSIYSRLLVDNKCRIKKPVFRDYDELEAILKYAFCMYDEFKKYLIEVYEKKAEV